MRNNCPCKGCEKRKVGCHANCFEYISWNDDRLLELLVINEKKEKERQANERIRDAQRKIKNIRIGIVIEKLFAFIGIYAVGMFVVMSWLLCWW